MKNKLYKFLVKYKNKKEHVYIICNDYKSALYIVSTVAHYEIFKRAYCNGVEAYLEDIIDYDC